MPSIDDFPGFLDEEALKDETLKRAQKKAEGVLLKERKRCIDSGEPLPKANDEAIIILGTMFVEVSKDLILRVARQKSLQERLRLQRGKPPKTVIISES